MCIYRYRLPSTIRERMSCFRARTRITSLHLIDWMSDGKREKREKAIYIALLFFSFASGSRIFCSEYSTLMLISVPRHFLQKVHLSFRHACWRNSTSFLSLVFRDADTKEENWKRRFANLSREASLNRWYLSIVDHQWALIWIINIILPQWSLNRQQLFQQTDFVGRREHFSSYVLSHNR